MLTVILRCNVYRTITYNVRALHLQTPEKCETLKYVLIPIVVKWAADVSTLMLMTAKKLGCEVDVFFKADLPDQG